MAPAPKSTGRPRGRPRKSQVELGSVQDSATSKVAWTPAPAPTTGRRRSARTSSAAGSSPYFAKSRREIVDSAEDSDELPSPEDLRNISLDKFKKGPTGRESISSNNTASESVEGTDYSTPLTSGLSTPAFAKDTGRLSRRLGLSGLAERPSMDDAATRARAERTARFSLGTKRKWGEEEDDEDEDEDVTRDARIASQLQAHEDAAADSMAVRTLGRRTPRRAAASSRSLAIKDSEDEDDDDDDFVASSHSKPRVELGSSSNAVTFAPKSRKKRRTLADSDGDEDDDDEFVPNTKGHVVEVGSPKKVVWKSASKTNQVDDSDFEASALSSLPSDDDDDDAFGTFFGAGRAAATDANPAVPNPRPNGRRAASRRNREEGIAERQARRQQRERGRLEYHHPEILTMWDELESLPRIGQSMIDQPININRELKPFQREGVAWMQAMEKTSWGGGLLGDEMGMGKTIQAVSLIMSDFPASKPSLVLIPPVALMQWQQEIADYTDGTLKTFVYHGTNKHTKTLKLADLKKFDVILMSYNSLESVYRKQEKGFTRQGKIVKEKSLMHQIEFHRVILDEAHSIKTRTTGSAKACFALKADHKWCLSGTPLQNRIGEFFSLIRFLNIQPFSNYFCKQCPCSRLEWEMNADNRCTGCNHSGMQHVSVFNQELLNPIQKYGNNGPGQEAFRKLRILTDRFMLRRVKRDHSSAMELPHKEIFVDRHFFGEEENDFAGSIMNNGTRKFETYVAQGVLLNNYANIFGLIMQMRQVADHPDLILKKNSAGGQNVLVCCICDEPAEEAIRSQCRHDFCRECAKGYLKSSDSPDCPRCHIALAIDLEAPAIEQDETQVKKSSIINRIKMEDWVSSTKIEALVQNLYQLRSNKSSTKTIIFSQFTSMLDLIAWRLHRAGISTVALDGSMTPAQRQASINHFMTDPSVECFLVSLKAGGVALNLTEANWVVLCEPFWNPAAEWQSADRVHRIGQNRTVAITRLCIEDSIESRIVELQEKKANMIKATLDSDSAALQQLTPADMQFLFRGH